MRGESCCKASCLRFIKSSEATGVAAAEGEGERVGGVSVFDFLMLGVLGAEEADAGVLSGNSGGAAGGVAGAVLAPLSLSSAAFGVGSGAAEGVTGSGAWNCAPWSFCCVSFPNILEPTYPS